MNKQYLIADIEGMGEEAFRHFREAFKVFLVAADLAPVNTDLLIASTMFHCYASVIPAQESMVVAWRKYGHCGESR